MVAFRFSAAIPQFINGLLGPGVQRVQCAALLDRSICMAYREVSTFGAVSPDAPPLTSSRSTPATQQVELAAKIRQSSVGTARWHRGATSEGIRHLPIGVLPGRTCNVGTLSA